MCGIIAIVRRASDRRPPEAAEITALVTPWAQRLRAVVDDDQLLGALRLAGDDLLAANQLLLGVPGVVCLLGSRELPSTLVTRTRCDHRSDQRDRGAPRDPIDAVVDRARAGQRRAGTRQRCHVGHRARSTAHRAGRRCARRAAAPAWLLSARTCRSSRRWRRSIDSKYADAIPPACTSSSPITT